MYTYIYIYIYCNMDVSVLLLLKGRERGTNDGKTNIYNLR